MDPQFVEKIVIEVKSQGVFDEFRKDSMADVDTKPAYQNLQKRVDTAVMKFLEEEERKWTPETNKNQLRERLRRHITESGFLDVGVERIVDQVVNPKIGSVFQPRIEEIAYKYLGIPQPPPQVYGEPPTLMGQFPPLPLHDPRNLQVETGGLLPTDLEQVSPDSDMATVRSESKSEHQDMDMDIDMDVEKPEDDDESPPFELLVKCTSPITRELEVATKEIKLTHENEPDKQQQEAKKLAMDGHDTEETIMSENSRQVDLQDSEKESSRFAVSQETQMSQISSESRISSISQSEFTATGERPLRSQVHELESPTVNMSEEAQMPKFNENSSDGNATNATVAGGENQSATHHFDIKKDEIKFEGTARKVFHLPPPLGNTKDSFDGEQPNGCDDNHLATSTASPVPYAEQSTTHTPRPPSAIMTGHESTFESSMDENVLTSDATETPQPASTKEDTANVTAPTTETSDLTLKPLKSPPPPPPTASRDKEDKCSSSQHSSSSSSSRHKKHDKDKHRSRDSSDSRDRSKSNRDRSSSTKSKHSSSSRSSKHSSSHTSKSGESHRRSESSRSHHSSSRSDSKRDRERDRDRDRERGRDSERSRSDRDKKQNSSSSSNSSRKPKSDADKLDDSKKTKANGDTKGTQSEVDDHNESKENAYRRKSNDSNDGGEKPDPGKVSSGSSGSTTGQSEGSSEKRENSQSSEAESKDEHKKTNETSTEATEHDKIRDEQSQQQQHKVVILNEILENPDTHFINLASSAKVDHIEIVRSASKDSEVKIDAETVEDKKTENSDTHLRKLASSAMVDKMEIVQSVSKDSVVKIDAETVEDKKTENTTDPEEKDNSPEQQEKSENPDKDDKVEQQQEKVVETKNEEKPVNKDIIVNEQTEKEIEITEDIQMSEVQHEKTDCDTGAITTNDDGLDSPMGEELFYFDGSDNTFTERIHVLEAQLGIADLSSNNINLSEVENIKTVVGESAADAGENRPKTQKSAKSMHSTTDPDQRLPHTPPKRFRHSEQDNETDRRQLQKPSPTPSDASSINSKENEVLERNVRSARAVKSKESAMLDKRTNAIAKLTRQQSYSSDDLYKPRPVLGQRSRRRGLDTNPEEATKMFRE